jgi:hypothetical protein
LVQRRSGSRAGTFAPCLCTPEESQVESCEHQDNANIHYQPFPESVSEDHEIYTDYDGCHRHHIKYDGYLSAHSDSLKGASRFRTRVERARLISRCAPAFCDEVPGEERGAGLRGAVLRRSAARNLERSGVPRSIAMQLGDKIDSRYAIAGERELGPAHAQMGRLSEAEWLALCGGTGEKSPNKSRRLVGGDGRSRTYDTADMSRML